MKADSHTHTQLTLTLTLTESRMQREIITIIFGRCAARAQTEKLISAWNVDCCRSRLIYEIHNGTVVQLMRMKKIRGKTFD